MVNKRLLPFCDDSKKIGIYDSFNELDIYNM